MAYTEFYCDPVNGNNMFGGSDATSAASFASTNGNWDGSSVFTVGSGTVTGVAVGQFAHVFNDGSTTPVYIARVTASTSTTITLSTTNKAGSAPTSNATGRSINVGGAWLGPNAGVSFPFNTMAGVCSNGTNQPRVNFKNNGTYNITAGITHTVAGQIIWQGYSSSPGDLGRAVVDGGTSGASYQLITLATFGSTLVDFVCQNNGATGTAAGVSPGSCNVYRTICHDVRGSAFMINSTAIVQECEAYNFNLANTNASGAGLGFQGNSSSATCVRCYAHDATAGSNCHGFGQLGTFIDCIADTLGGSGFVNASAAGSALMRFINCDAYNCTGSGMDLSLGNQTSLVYAENCNFIKNGAWGIKASGTGICSGLILNCGFGSGTQANTSGTSTYASTTAIVESGSITYASNVTPWVAPSTGNFSINLPAAETVGRGNFMQTGNAKTGTVGYPDVGAAPHAASGGLLLNPSLEGL